VIVDEKYFRGFDTFERDGRNYRAWLYDLLGAIGQVDGRLAAELMNRLRRNLDAPWDPESDSETFA